ncbi:MAG: hypothetical protein K0U34_06855, partial [Alphaproteobacteria bacterium]|nr:hypothetical protein [Alphaproteobacteria bacterium]
MPTPSQHHSFSPLGAATFRTALFGAAASLAIFILYKLVTTLHATEGFYAFMFPWSALLALAGMTLAIKPRMSCDCSVPMRSGVGAVAILWMATGAICGPGIVEMAGHSPMRALYVGSLMTTQHIFLSSVILAFAFAPTWMTRKLGVAVPDLDVRSNERA